MSKNSIKDLSFPNEKAEADWYHTPEGKAHMLRSLKKASREGTIRIRNVASDKPPTKAELKQLIELAQAARAEMTQAISIRIPTKDLEAAKRLAEKTGKGYQTVLKEIIHEGLQRAS